MTQLLTLELALHNQNSMQKGDWTPLLVSSQPKKPKPSTEEIDAIAASILDVYLTEQFLASVIESACDGSYDKKRLGVFMNAVVTSMEQNAELQKELEAK